MFSVKNLKFKFAYRTEAVCVKVAGNSVFSQAGFANSNFYTYTFQLLWDNMIETLSQLHWYLDICQLKFYL